MTRKKTKMMSMAQIISSDLQSISSQLATFFLNIIIQLYIPISSIQHMCKVCRLNHTVSFAIIYFYVISQTYCSDWTIYKVFFCVCVCCYKKLSAQLFLFGVLVQTLHDSSTCGCLLHAIRSFNPRGKNTQYHAKQAVNKYLN